MKTIRPARNSLSPATASTGESAAAAFFIWREKFPPVICIAAETPQSRIFSAACSAKDSETESATILHCGAESASVELAFAHQVGQALHSQGESAAGRLGQPDGFGESVVSPAAAEDILAALVVGEGPFKDGKIIVVQPAHQQGILGEGDSGGGDFFANRIHMPAGFITEFGGQRGGFGDDGEGLGVFGIQNAEGVGVYALLGAFVQLVGAAAEVLGEFFAVLGALGSGAEVVDLEDEFILDSESAPEALEEEDLFGVHRGGLGAEGFGVQLVELPLPSLLGALAAEHGAELPDAGDAVADGGGLG